MGFVKGGTPGLGPPKMKKVEPAFKDMKRRLKRSHSPRGGKPAGPRRR